MSLKSSPIRRLEFTNRDSVSQVINAQPSLSQKLSSQLYQKDLQIKSLYQQNTLLKLKCEEQIANYVQTINILETQLRELQIIRTKQFNAISQKYNQLNSTHNINEYHTHQAQFLMTQIANLRIDSTAKDEQLMQKQRKITQLVQNYQKQLQQKTIIIANLTRGINIIENTKNKQIKQINTQRQLQRSRTSIVVQTAKENNQFIDKQIKKLNQEILQKDLKIQNLIKELTKNKRKSQEMEKLLIKKLDQLKIQNQIQIQQRQQYYSKIEKSLKQQLMLRKAKQLQLLSQLDTSTNTILPLRSQIKRHEDTIKSQQQQIIGYKNTLQKQRQHHAKQLSNLLKQKKKKSPHLALSARSLGTSSKDGSEQQYSKIKQLQHSYLPYLPIVKQQSQDYSIEKTPVKNLTNYDKHSEIMMQSSNFTPPLHSPAVEQQNQLSKIVLHYTSIIQQLKKTHTSQIQLLQHKISKLTKNLDQKQQQTLDILTKFSPLVKIHALEKTIQQDRKQRIEKHWKADLALLSILLDKYQIQTYLIH